MKPTLYLVMGLPGSGKSSLGHWLLSGHDNIKHLEADMYFLDEDGGYHFSRDHLSKAHEWCRHNTSVHLLAGDDVVVCNTFSMEWERQIYRDAAQYCGAEVVEITIKTHHTDEELAERNIHGCPVKKIREMRERWEHSLF